MSAPPPPSLAPEGTTYLGRVGSGATFEVTRVKAGARVLACKRLTSRARQETAGKVALAREALFLERARHAALPSLFRTGMDAHGPFLLEAFQEGVSLQGLSDGWRRRGHAVPPRLVAHIAGASTKALATIHALEDARGLLQASHGDLTPEHVLLGPLGEIRFVDFGAARLCDLPDDLATDDRGTLPFAAPEVVRGETPPGQAADVYALAATLLFLATGEPLTEKAEEPAMMLEVGERGLRLEPCARASGLGEHGRDALRRALAFSPEDRIDALALASALA